MKKLLQFILKIQAKIVLAKYRPKVVGVTGSVGKTGAKEAVYTVLAEKYNVRRSTKNYNNEIGVPLTVVGMDSPGKSFIGWFIVFLRAAEMIFVRNKDYPEVLVLEMGIDRPRDMKYLNSIVKCDIGVITAIGESHLEFFESIEQIQREKWRLIENLRKKGTAVLNYDDGKIRALIPESGVDVLTFGLEDGADIRADRVSVATVKNAESGEDGTNKIQMREVYGVSFGLKCMNDSSQILLPHVISRQAVYAALAGAAVGQVLGIEIKGIRRALGNYTAPRGRMNVIPGIKHTLIIDDTYNSSPQSSLAALDTLAGFPAPDGARRFAALGDMLELGSYSEEGHREVGRHVFGSDIDQLVLVGERSRDIAAGAEEAGMFADNIFHFDTPEEAGKFMQERIEEGDIILIKGSQAVRMEKVVREIMAEPERAGELLVRQEEEWIKK